jgi:group I intron endonuclease
MVGIYKITSPSGKVYIGQSVNLKKRRREYSHLQSCKNQKKLYVSLVKYGFSEHIFEVIEECEVGVLNERERHWQDFYNVLGEGGLNLRLTQTNDRSGHCSQETANRIGDGNRGRKKPPRTGEHRKNLSNSLKGNKPSELTRQKFREIRMGKTGTESWKGANNPSARAVRDTETEQVYETVRAAAKAIGVLPATLQAWLSGRNKNKSTMEFL